RLRGAPRAAVAVARGGHGRSEAGRNGRTDPSPGGGGGRPVAGPGRAARWGRGAAPREGATKAVGERGRDGVDTTVLHMKKVVARPVFAGRGWARLAWAGGGRATD